MMFASPLAGLVAAAVAGPVLLALYLLRLRRRPLRVGSTMLWERAVQDLQVNVPLRWLRVSMPLVLQAMALLGVCVALARPVFNPLGGGGGGRVVLLIDRSGVMCALDGKGSAEGVAVSRLEEAKAAALETIDALRRSGQATEVMVVQFAHSPQVLAAFTSDLPTLHEAVRSIMPTDQPADLMAALKILEPFVAPPPPALERSGEDEPSAAGVLEVLVFSCGALEDRAGAGPADRATAAATARAPRGIRARLVRAGPTEDRGAEVAGGAARANLGILAFSARRENDDPATLRVFVRVGNAGAAPVETTVRLAFEGREPELASVVVPGATGTAGAARAGEASVNFSISETDGGVLVCQLPGVGDADLLPSDDSAALVIGPARRPRILLVGAGGGEAPDPFLRSGLAAIEPERLEETDALGYERRAGDGTIARDFDLVVLDRARVRGAPGVATMAFACAPPLPGVAVAAQTGVEASRALVWDRRHPVLRHAPLDGLFVSPPMNLRIAGDSPLKVATLAEGEQGPLIAAISEDAGAGAGGGGEPGRRHLVVAFELARSNWGPDPSFPVFLAAAVDWLTLRAQSQSGRAFTTFEVVPVVPAPGSAALEVVGPVSLVVRATTGTLVGPLERAGLYRVSGAAGMEAVAVNTFDERATSLAGSGTLPMIGDAGEAVSAGSGPREVWHWFVLAALVLATAEWFVYAWQMRG
ncbi:MAG: vWA domain-containing protein [Phycisphaerales bacterium]